MTDIDLFIDNVRTGAFSLLFVTGGDVIEAVNSTAINQSIVATGFQHAAWTIGILAGIVAIVNGIDGVVERKRCRKRGGARQ